MRNRLLGPFLLLLLVAFSAGFRVERAVSDPGFDVTFPEGMMKSDPALLYYITERILDAGGLPPEDFRADPRVEHPDLVDLPERFTVGQEFLVAWAYRALGGDTPLHLFCVRFFAVVASLALVGVYGLVLARTRSHGWALGAAALAAFLPASYRTLGFVLIREDLSLPLFALHLGLAARALGRPREPGESDGSAPRVGSALAAGIALAAALATWHAMTFIVLLEAAAVFGLYLLRRTNPLRGRAGLAFLLPVVVAAVLVPALRSKGLLFAPPLALGFGLAWAGRAAAPAALWRRAAVPGLVALVFVGAGLLLSSWHGGGAADLRHVYEVMAAKVVHLGALPADPNALSFDARLLWQGPFETLPLAWVDDYLGWAVAVAAVAFALRLRGRFGDDELGLLLFTAVCLVVAWLFLRLVVLPALLLPALAAILLARRGPSGAAPARWPAALLGGAVLLQGWAFAGYAGETRIAWYADRAQTRELEKLVAWVDVHVPPGEPIVADFVNSTAILAHTGRPIAIQPKYEAAESRRRAEAFLKTFFHGSPADLATLVRQRFGARYVLVDTLVLGTWSTYTAGLPAGRAPAPGTAAARMLDDDPFALLQIEGFELVYLSEPPDDLFRLFRLTD